jgi:hypothetical protein
MKKSIQRRRRRGHSFSGAPELGEERRGDGPDRSFSTEM